MSDSGIFKVTIDCPSCGKPLRIPSPDDYLRLRCPHCAHEFEYGIASAEVVSEPAEAVILLQADVAAPTSETSGSDFTTGETIGCWMIVLLAALVIVGGTWLFSSKRQVVVVEQTADGIVAPGESWFDEYWFNAPEDRLLGAPAALARLVGLQSPSEIVGEGGRVKVADTADKAHEANDVIIVNQTKGDIWYTALIYGDEAKADRNAEQGPIRIAPGTAAAALGKTHGGPTGGYNVGCDQAPDESESFGTSNSEDLDFAVLGWVTDRPPQDCPNAPPAVRNDQ